MSTSRACHLAVLAHAVLVLGGCMHVPVTTLYKLWSTDMAAADPGLMRVATRTPRGLAPRPGGVKLTYTAWRDGDTVKRVYTFVLAEANEAAELAPLAKYKRVGDVVSAFRLNAADIQQLRALQAESREETASIKGKPHGEIGISADACRREALGSGPILTSTYLLVSPADGYLPVLDDIDLREELGVGDLATHLPPCGVQ